MICGNCGAHNRPDRRFCLQCGNALAQACANCGTQNEPEARFCGNCGQPLSASEPAVSPRPDDAQSASAAAERRLVSVLFADLVGFTPFAEESDAEDVRATLQRYFELAREVIDRYGGTVEKFIGDAVMAVWGTPTAHEDDAERAVRAALDLIDVVQTLGPSIQARAGILTGEAAVSTIAVDQGLLAGDLVNTAARLQSVAPPATVLVGESTMHAASAALTFEPAGDQALKGKSAPVPAWRALRVVAQRRGAGRAEALETPFVGRQEEMRLLRELLHLGGRDPRARLVSITGPAGIGKSRLAWELEKYIDGVVEKIYWHRGRCPAYGEGVTFWALGEMVRSRARLAETDDEATTRSRLSETVNEYVADPGERAWIVDSLLALLGLEPAPQGGREMLFAAWRRFFESVALRGTTVLVFEDLHWADSGLLDFIDNLLDWSKNAPLLVVTLARPELFDKRPNWGANRRTYTAMALDPLSEADMRALLQALVPDLQENALTAIVQRADGIPLYAVETVRMLLADGRLEVVGETCRPTGELGDIAVPNSLRSLITSRLDGLAAADRSLLQDASVLGHSFTVDSLTAVSGASPDELPARLQQLVRRELLTVEADPRSPERGQYAFMQSLTREVAYSTLARAERRSRHLAAARHFESVGGDELAGILATHYVAAYEASAAGEESRAVATQARLALRGAADRAAALGSHAQAAGYLEQAVAVTSEPEERAALHERQSIEFDMAGRYDAAEARARDAIALYESLNDVAAAARARSRLGILLIHAQRVKDAITELEQAVAALPEDADAQVQADAMAALARGYYRNLEAERSIVTADRALAIGERHGLTRTIADALVSKGTALSMLSHPLEALVLLTGGSELALRVGDTATALRGWANQGHLLGSFQGVDDALATTRRAVELARKVGDLGQFIWQLGNLAAGTVFAGQPLQPVLDELEEAFQLDLDDSDRHRLEETYLLPAMFRGLDVTERVERWVQHPLTARDPQNAASAHGMRAWSALVRGDYAAVADEFSEHHRLRPDFGFGSTAALAAVMGGDASLARRILADLQQGSGGLPADAAFRRATEAALLAQEGRRQEAVQLFRERALRPLNDLGARLEVGFVALAMARTLGSNLPEVSQALEDALATFERMGSQPMLRQVRAELEGAPDEPAQASAHEPSGQPAELETAH